MNFPMRLIRIVEPRARPGSGRFCGGVENGATQMSRVLAAATLMLIVSVPAWSQVNIRQFGDYTVRSSTVTSENLSRETASAHGIERDPRRAVLNVTVLKNNVGVDKTVPAGVQAHVRNLTGQRRDIDMRETAAEGRVSYMGTYEFSHGEALDFTITIQPENSGKTFTMNFRERLWARGALPGK